MPDVPLYVAIITAGASAISGSIPLVVNWARDSGHDKRAAAERRSREQLELTRKKREQSVSLLKLTRDFRVLAESVYGPDGSVARGSEPGKSVSSGGCRAGKPRPKISCVTPRSALPGHPYT